MADEYKDLLNFIIVCEDAFLSQTNTLSIIKIFDKLKVEKVPAVIAKFSIVTKFKTNNGSHDHKIIIKNEQSDIIAELKGTINIEDSKSFGQYIGTFLGLRFESFGKYTIEIEIDTVKQNLNTEFYVEKL